ncbi:MerR family transcriptional regulator [Kribbella deserti]|uniref:MerR family transcriptional regulator n=1 Tax=Kribbella deserti TaxID=1926257 RepID=A0ABV6QKJ5_9ACTN
MNGDTLYSIGELARRTGLTVKTVRFYSDRGIVEPLDRSPAGYRRYGTDAVARLDLVRTLRELGLDLATIQKVLDRELSLAEVATAHAEALAVQLRILARRRAVLTAVAKRGSTPEEMDLMHKFAKLSEQDRHRLIENFLDSIFGQSDTDPLTFSDTERGSFSHAGFGTDSGTDSSTDSGDGSSFGGSASGPGAPELEWAAARRSMTPELPDDPSPEQVEAWIELAELTFDLDFRASLQELARQYQADSKHESASEPDSDSHSHSDGGNDVGLGLGGVRLRGRGGGLKSWIRRDLVATVRDLVRPALQDGMDPASPAADGVVATLLTAYERDFAGRPTDNAGSFTSAGSSANNDGLSSSNAGSSASNAGPFAKNPAPSAKSLGPSATNAGLSATNGGPSAMHGGDVLAVEGEDPRGRKVQRDQANALVDRLLAARDPRRERYLELLAVVNGWSPPESLAPTLNWAIDGIRARL